MRIALWTLIALLVGVGCAPRQHEAASNATTVAATTHPTDPALLSLDEIEPRPVLPTRRATTQPTTRPSLDAIQLYAQARAAQWEGDRARAVLLLERAVARDSESFELNLALAQAYLAAGAGADSAIRAMERAASIEPDNVEVRLLLGRQFLAKADPDKAIEQLRLAMQTPDFKSRPEIAAMVNLFLAKALHQKGYDLAALAQFEELLGRIKRRLNLRSAPELYHLVGRPDLLHLQIGQINEKHGRYEKALESYQAAADHVPESFEYRSRVVHALLGLNRVGEARSMATDLVSMHEASAESLALLKEAYRSTKHPAAVADALEEIHKHRPDDRAITFALADVYNSSGRVDDAEQLLLAAMKEKPQDMIIISRLFEFYYARGDTEAAARLLVETTARDPDSLQLMQPMWTKLLRPSAKNRLRLPIMQRLSVSPEAQAAKLFLTARLAELVGRDVAARSSLERAVTQPPPFAPAYRELLGDYLRRQGWSEKQKSAAAEKLISQAKQQNRPDLAAELNGLVLEMQKKPAEAAKAFEEAVRLGNRWPGVQFALASALMASHKEPEAEALLWTMVERWPSLEEAYLMLFRRYLDRGQGPQAIKVLQTWLAADPRSVNARLVQINVFAQSGNEEVAESSLMSLFREESDNPAVVAEMTRFLVRGDREETLISRLEEERARRPDNQVVVETLVRLYTDRKRSAEAVRVIDALRAAVTTDTDRLYYVAHLYEQVQRREMTEQVLREILQIDPQNGPAGNDLGYMWADDGKNLSEAEELIRMAARAEPDNGAYLDSLGWVLYKRGKYEEARQYLDHAAKLNDGADPVVLDHLGDALYRLEQRQQAAEVWRKSLERLSESKQDREDLKQLLPRLKRKLSQHRDGKPVDVAPSIETDNKSVRAEN